MSPDDCDRWIGKMVSNLKTSHPGYYLDRVVYWRLMKSKSVTIHRDDKWFEQHLPIYDKMWKYVQFLRNNTDKKEILFNYIDNLQTKNTQHIMDIIKRVCEDHEKDDYNAFLTSLMSLKIDK